MQISIYSHKDEFIDLLYNDKREIEGQCIDPVFTQNANGSNTLTFSIPIKILNKNKTKYIDNPRWKLVNKQYKIRVEKEGEDTQEFVLKNYTESHTESNELLIDVECSSFAEFDLGQIGYDITLNENTLYQYPIDENPNDPDSKPIGTYNSDIHFWLKIIMKKIPDWSYKVESYYPVDEDLGDNDNRQKTDPNNKMKTGKEQFYEDDRIIGYDDNNEPIYSGQYEIKERIIVIEKSNVWNIIQELCEKYECWPTFKITYDANGKIVSKEIIFKNDIETEAQFTIHYRKNLKNASREVDFSSIVTKMYVIDIENDNVDNGIISISDNEKNFMKENYLLNLDWYLGKNVEDLTEIDNIQLIDSNLSMTFSSSEYATPNIINETINGTEKIIEKYQANIRARNIYISNKSNEINKLNDELISLKTDYETYLAERDSAQETYNKVYDEWKLCPQGEQVKTDRKCYLYEEEGSYVVRFSEIGIRESDFPKSKDLYSPVNLVFTSGEKVTEDNISALQWEPIEWDEIIGTVTKAKVINVIPGSDQNYGSFSCDLIYYPLEYYNKLKKYWNSKVEEAISKLLKLGKPVEEGGTSGLIYETTQKLAQEKLNLYNAQKDKQTTIIQFETLFRPYIREGFWEDTDYSIFTNKSFTVTPLEPLESPLISSVSNEVEWTQDKICYKIPNSVIGNYIATYEEIFYDADGNAQVVETQEEKQVTLYDVIDIDTIEIMTKNPSEPKDITTTFKTYVLGTDFEVEYGYTTYDTNDTNNLNRGIYITKTQPSTSSGEIGVNTKLYFRFKARGSKNYIYKGYLTPIYNSSEMKRPYFAQMERKIQLTQDNIVLSSIIVNTSTALVNSDSFGTIDPKIISTNYDLIYGKDYYTAKEVENNKIVTNIYLYETSNTPLGNNVELTDKGLWYNVTLNQDITSKYYYNDATQVLKESIIPQTKYNIDIVNLEKANHPDIKYDNFKPKVGTRVYIFDKSLNFNGISGFIESIQTNLLNDRDTTITITNYKDKFEDLFQKVTASTIALDSKSYEYDKSTTILDVQTGAIKPDLIEDALLQANAALALSKNNDVVWDNSGITVTNKDLNSAGVYGKLKITSNGIFLANKYNEFGDYAWETAITPDFINANLLRAGSLDTKQIQIYNSSEPSFIWNSNGIFAYNENSNGSIDYDNYVVFNKDGLRFRELTNFNHNYILDNLFKDSLITDYNNWDITGASYSLENILYNNNNITITKINGSQTINEISMITNTNRLTKSDGSAGLVKGHKYYYRFIMKYNNLPQESELNVYFGFTGRYEEYSFEELENMKDENGWIICSGIIEYLNPIETFGIITVLNRYQNGWYINFGTPMIIDITEVFGSSVPLKSSLDTIDYFLGIKPITNNSLKVYQDAVVLGWNGLSIGAQEGVVQLTSTDGLSVFAPISSENFLQKRLRLQLGTWTDDDGTQKYGLRGLKNGIKVFEISQDGAKFSYNDDQDLGTIDNIIDASISYDCYINSSNGTTFINGNINTILEAIVMKGTEVVTNLLAEGNFIWKKIDSDGTEDETWTPNYVAGSNHSKITITSQDVEERATFVCEILVDET